jgi:hypothetical protein
VKNKDEEFDVVARVFKQKITSVIDLNKIETSKNEIDLNATTNNEISAATTANTAKTNNGSNRWKYAFKELSNKKTINNNENHQKSMFKKTFDENGVVVDDDTTHHEFSHLLSSKKLSPPCTVVRTRSGMFFFLF